MNSSRFAAAMQNILRENQKFNENAYKFLLESIDYTVSQKRIDNDIHVSAQQLLEGFRELSLEKFGPMALTILREWGINSCADIGEMVFALIEHGALEKQPDDRREDFIELYSFKEAFEVPFQPKFI